MLLARHIFLVSLFLQIIVQYPNAAQMAEGEGKIMSKGFLQATATPEELKFLENFTSWSPSVEPFRAEISKGNPDAIRRAWAAIKNKDLPAEHFAFLLLSLTETRIGNSCLLLGHAYKNKTQPSGITQDVCRSAFWYTQALEDPATKSEAEVYLGTRRDPGKEYDA